MNTFDETTGECFAACGGDSISGHAADCPLAGVEKLIEALGKMEEIEDRNVDGWDAWIELKELLAGLQGEVTE